MKPWEIMYVDFSIYNLLKDFAQFDLSTKIKQDKVKI